jgi:hypothetical protein
MDMKLAKELANRAAVLGICKEWHDNLTGLSDRHAMAEMYLKGIDFCLANDYPANDFIKRHFGDVIHTHGIFVDEEMAGKDLRKCVLLGRCRGRLEQGGFGTSEVFVKHRSTVEIVARGHAFVMVDAFDNAVVNVQASDHARVCVNLYGDAIANSSSEGTATVKVLHKHHKTYGHSVQD